MSKFTSLICEGIDNIGKSGLIEKIQQELGYFQVIHFAKPKLLGYFQDQVHCDNEALEEYQRRSFENGFKLLETGLPFIYDRSFLGESCYSDKYRGYDGSYVFELETQSLLRWKQSQYPKENIPYPAKLILLTTSDFSIIIDDGLSFDSSRQAEEQLSFIDAFRKSKMPKAMIDVCNGKGGFKDPMDILKEALHG